MPILFPAYRINRVTDLTPDRLRKMGLTALLLDVDCTLKRYSAQLPDQDILDWIGLMRSSGIFLCLLSNGKVPRISRTAESLGLPFIAMALKPFPCGCRKAMKKYCLEKKNTAIVGDQLFADIIAGNSAGLTSILVTPIHPEEEHWFTRIKRPFERILLRSSRGVRHFPDE